MAGTWTGCAADHNTEVLVRHDSALGQRRGPALLQAQGNGGQWVRLDRVREGPQRGLVQGDTNAQTSIESGRKEQGGTWSTHDVLRCVVVHEDAPAVGQVHVAVLEQAFEYGHHLHRRLGGTERTLENDRRAPEIMKEGRRI